MVTEEILSGLRGSLNPAYIAKFVWAGTMELLIQGYFNDTETSEAPLVFVIRLLATIDHRVTMTSSSLTFTASAPEVAISVLRRVLIIPAKSTQNLDLDYLGT